MFHYARAGTHHGAEYSASAYNRFAGLRDIAEEVGARKYGILGDVVSHRDRLVPMHKSAIRLDWLK